MLQLSQWLSPYLTCLPRYIFRSKNNDPWHSKEADKFFLVFFSSIVFVLFSRAIPCCDQISTDLPSTLCNSLYFIVRGPYWLGTTMVGPKNWPTPHDFCTDFKMVVANLRPPVTASRFLWHPPRINRTTLYLYHYSASFWFNFLRKIFDNLRSVKLIILASVENFKGYFVWLLPFAPTKPSFYPHLFALLYGLPGRH